MTNVLENFNKRMQEISKALKDVEEAGTPKGSSILDYKAGKAHYLKKTLERSIQDLRNDSWNLVKLRIVSKDNEYPLLKILNSTANLKLDSTVEEVKKYLDEVLKLSSSLKAGQAVEKKVLSMDVPDLPEEIMPDLLADLNEIRKCFDAASYRSCVILCGRVLETALNRKYFEATGNDLLETSPGLGLGKIVAKLDEKNIKTDPGLTQQIHLINQIRIFSVHSKRDAFYPSKSQAEAMILYTIDVLRKLFA